jgi:diadenosine tetraphosphate (Ap4A) HIT family hydrolase
MNVRPAECPFCCHDAIEPQLVFETAQFLLVADRYPLRAGHLLLVPREHLACYGELTEALVPELSRLKGQVADFLSASYGPPTFFEHGVAGQTIPHAHLHAVPGLSGLLTTVAPGRTSAPAAGAEAIRSWFYSRGPYLYCEEDGQGLLLEPGEIPAGYLQRVAAGLLAAPRGDLNDRAVAQSVRLAWQRHRAVVAGAVIDFVACFLQRAGLICLLRRGPTMDSAANKWHMVSGYLPEGADPLRHALLEIEQETGLGAGQVRLVRSAEPLLLQRPGDVRRWRVYPFLFEVVAGEPRLNWEHVDLRWVVPGDVAGFDTVGWLPSVLERLSGTV